MISRSHIPTTTSMPKFSMKQLVFFLVVILLTVTGIDNVSCEHDSNFMIDETDGALETLKKSFCTHFVSSVLPDQSELIRKYGYPIETHKVSTSDGYILSLIRIPPRSQSSRRSLPVLLVHGLFASSADFVIIGPNNSIAYLLADNEYDVWMLDVRGNRYSRHHEHLDSRSKEYWDFSWHEIGYYDLPATIDRILELTLSKQLYYVGYSQGTTLFFVMATTRPEYNGKVARMYALSPALYVQHVRSPIFRWLAENASDLKALLDTIGIWQLFPHSSAQYKIQKILCPSHKKRTICARFVELLVGPNPHGTDQLAQYIISGHNPSGASTKQLLHFAQLNRAGRFQQFDYGHLNDNLIHYGSETPPAYNLSLATVPVVIYYGLNDWMIHPRNVIRLKNELVNLVSINAVADLNFNHLDFILAKQVRSLVYEKILKDLEQLET